MISRSMRLSALSLATEQLKLRWEALGYRIEIIPKEPFAAEIEIYDGEVYLDTIQVIIRRKVK